MLDLFGWDPANQTRESARGGVTGAGAADHANGDTPAGKTSRTAPGMDAGVERLATSPGGEQPGTFSTQLYPVPRRTGSIPWERLLEQLEDQSVTIYASAHWTGVALEVATGARVGRQMWRSDGSIEPLGEAGGFEPGRLVFVTPKDALQIARGRALTVAGRPGRLAIRLCLQEGPPSPAAIAALEALAHAASSESGSVT